MNQAQARTRSELLRVIQECERWGVPIRFGKPSPNDKNWSEFSEGPRIGGIHWPTRTIWFPRNVLREDAPMALLHELSHVLADIDPEFVDEISSGMLMFEYATARRLKLQWSSWMSDYVVPSGLFDCLCWPELTTQERGELLHSSHRKAIKDGILDAAGRPTYRLPRPLARTIASFRSKSKQAGERNA